MINGDRQITILKILETALANNGTTFTKLINKLREN